MKLLRGTGWSFQQRKDTAEPGWMAARKLFSISFPAEKRAGSFTAASTNDLMAGLPADAKSHAVLKNSPYNSYLNFGCLHVSVSAVARSPARCSAPVHEVFDGTLLNRPCNQTHREIESVCLTSLDTSVCGPAFFNDPPGNGPLFASSAVAADEVGTGQLGERCRKP